MENANSRSLFKELLDAYRGNQGSLITVLQKAQDIFGYLPKDVLYDIAGATGNTPARVMGVVTFYSQFRLEPAGKNIVMLCKGTACHVNNADAVDTAVSGELSVKDNETTPDGLFTFKNVACLGCCSLAPVMTINGAAFGSLTPEKAAEIIRNFKKQ